MDLHLLSNDILLEICANMDISSIANLHASSKTAIEPNEEKISLVSMIPQKHIEGCADECLLHYALKRGIPNHVSLDHIKEIFARHQYVMFVTDKEGRSLLLCALMGRHDFDTLEYILKITPTQMMSKCDYQGISALDYSLMYYPNDIKLLIKLVSEIPELLKIVDFQYSSIMHYACQYGSSRTILEFLCLVCPSLLSREDNSGKIPLHYGLHFWENERESLIKLFLCKTGRLLYDKHGVGKEGSFLSYSEFHENASLLMCAANNKVSFETLKILSAHDPLIIAMQDVYGRSVLYYMIRQDYDVESILWFANLNPNCIYERYTNGDRLLHMAIEAKMDIKVLRAFCGTSGNIFSAINNRGITPMQMLLHNDTAEEIVREFLIMNIEHLDVGMYTGNYHQAVVMLVNNPLYVNLVRNLVEMNVELIIKYSLIFECMRSKVVDSDYILDMLAMCPHAIYTKDRLNDLSPLHTLIRTGRANMKMVVEVLKYDNSQIQKHDGFRPMPFQLALQFNDGLNLGKVNDVAIKTNVLHYLLECYEEVVYTVDLENKTPLHSAMNENIDVSIAKRLLQLNRFQNTHLNEYLQSPVHTAMMYNYGNEDFLQEMILLNPENMNLDKYYHNVTPLYSAIINNFSISMVKFIISKNKKLINMTTLDGNSLLHCLMQRILYDRKNSSKSQRTRKKYHFSKSERQEILQILSLLLKSGLRTLCAVNTYDETPVHLAFSFCKNRRLRDHISEIMVQYMSRDDALVCVKSLGTPLYLAISQLFPSTLIEKLIHLNPDSILVNEPKSSTSLLEKSIMIKSDTYIIDLIINTVPKTLLRINPLSKMTPLHDAVFKICQFSSDSWNLLYKNKDFCREYDLAISILHVLKCNRKMGRLILSIPFENISCYSGHCILDISMTRPNICVHIIENIHEIISSTID